MFKVLLVTYGSLSTQNSMLQTSLFSH